MSFRSSISTYRSDSTIPDQIFQLEDSSIATASLQSDKIEKLKRFLPKPKQSVSRKLRKLLSPKQKCIKHDFISGPIKRIDHVEKEKPFTYPKDLNLFGERVMKNAWREDVRIKELQQQLKEKKTMQGKLNKDLMERLRVKELPKDSTLYIQDFDPDYMKVVEGRPFGDINMSMKDYMHTVREVLKTKIMLGYRQDDICLIDAQIKTEQRMIKLIQKNYDRYVEIFEEFLFRDQMSALNLLKRSNQITDELYSVKGEYAALSKKLKGITISLYRAEATWMVCKLQKAFLYNCSPLYWRKKHRAIESSNHDDRIDTNELAELIEEFTEQSELTLSDILKKVKDECTTHEPQELYFTKPQQLVDMFEYMQTQNLNDLTHNEELAQPLAQIQENMDVASQNFDQMIKNFHNYADRLEIEIEYEEKRVAELEKVAHFLIFTEFKALISTEEVLSLHSYVEDAYESVIGPNDACYNAKKMINVIEEQYRSQLSLLDRIPNHIVHELESSALQEQAKIIRYAEKANKQIAELDHMTKQVIKSFGLPYQKPRFKPLMFRSPPKGEYKEIETPQRVLTNHEQDYLDHFTEFCKYSDNPTNFGINMEENKEEGKHKVREESKSINITKTALTISKR